MAEESITIRHTGVMPKQESARVADPPLGERLRELRESEGWSLREVATKAGVNHGYLSQLERGDVSQPGPAMLHKLADGYGESFLTLMRWAGYVEPGDSALTGNQQRALSYLGDDVSDEEVAAIKAILDVLRTRRATMTDHIQSLDGELSPEERKEIRARVVLLLRRADAWGIVPTPLDQVMEVAQLVAAGEVTLEPEERRQLRKMFGSLVDVVMDRLQGVIHFRSRELWVSPDLHALRRRFVTAHEIGHDALPWQRDSIAYLDDAERLRTDVRFTYERQANQAAIELLAQGDTLRKEADDSRFTAVLLSQLSAKYQISMQAISRRVVEDSRHDVALAIRFRGASGRLGPYHVYCSDTFNRRFGWHPDVPVEARGASREAITGCGTATFHVPDLASTFVTMEVETINTPRAVLVLFLPARQTGTLRRLLRAG